MYFFPQLSDMESGIGSWKAVHRVYIFQEYLVSSHHERLHYIEEKLKAIAWKIGTQLQVTLRHTVTFEHARYRNDDFNDVGGL